MASKFGVLPILIHWEIAHQAGRPAYCIQVPFHYDNLA
ncbi:hypothetical protein T4A_8911 [Trichinella pseudospiralis]|uniref:Uncharacterized protein n=1 Tax=Trichinella pseudospiralis TaxID=6337 RepID=A0A0V1DS51_TRIPS|nr:hypothetical protein T4A_7982 [Trichinella pseudospiralis]KRY64408.1 hypothetical protein T4A_8911 [Trichinella pseudospiralis]